MNYRINPHQITPQAVFDAAEHDASVKAILGHWLEGDLNWEQALVWMVVILSSQKEHLEKESVKHLSGKYHSGLLSPTPPPDMTRQ